jgi:hypothetical protein
MDVLLAPVPAVAFVSMTVLVVVVAWFVANRTAGQWSSAVAKEQESATRERQKAEELAKQLEVLQTSLQPRFELARRIAATIESPGKDVKPTRDAISRIVLGFTGNSHSEAEISQTLGWMLEERIAFAHYGEIQLTRDWRERLNTLNRRPG